MKKVSSGSGRAADLVREANNTRDARTKLEALVASVVPDLPSGFIKPSKDALDVADVDSQFVTNAKTQVKVMERRLEQCIRSLRRESNNRASPTAMRVLGNDALRLMIEVAGWRRLAESASDFSDGAKGGSALVAVRTAGGAEFAKVQQLHRFLTSTDPKRHRPLAAIAFDDIQSDKGMGAGAKPNLTAEESAALVDILQSSDPGRRGIVGDRLKDGASLPDIRSMLLERMIPVSLAAPTVGDDAKVDAGGLMFDLGTNTFVQRDLSWAYDVTVGQLFDYVVDGICDGKEELATRMTMAATNPTTGEMIGASEDEIRSFVEDLAAAASVGHASVDELLAGKFTMCFSTTDFGSKPVSADWELPRGATADLFHAMTNEAFRGELKEVAAGARSQKAARAKEVREPLAELLAKYDGVPRRHKRAHAALINLGLAGQGIQEMGREDGVLPRSRTLLDPGTVTRDYADQHVKLRFLFTDEFEMFVLSDQMFGEVVDKYHFPPNHELLSYNRPIAGSGYVTIENGEIVAVEDDIVMCPGKMPDNLPPALEVLEARGFALDHERIAEASRVLDWEAFADIVSEPPADLVAAPKGTPEEIHERLETCAHGERPALVAAAILGELERQRGSNTDEAVARNKTEGFVKEILRGFQIINVSARDFRKGDLPNNMSEFDEMKIDDVLAPFLVRKAAGQ